ncbi:MAG: hypothetical protein ACE5I5_10790 [Candidatus Heimdallarchaeota archaeon]
MDLNKVLAPHLNNFKRLFYKQTKQSEEHLSVVKLAIFGAFIIANILAFLQFATLTDPVPQQITESPIEPKVLKYQISMTIYGTFAHYLNFVVLVGAVFYFITQDKPLSVLAQQFWDWVTKNQWHLIGMIVGVGVAGVYTLTRLRSFSLSSLAIGLSYGMGLGMNIVWWLLQPVLFLSGALLVVDTFMLVDQSFKERFGDLIKPTKKTVGLVFVDILIIVIFFVVAETIFHVTLNTGENLGSITRVAGIGFYKTTIFWLLTHFVILISFTVFIMVILFGVHILKRSRSEAALILSILFVGVVLIALISLKLSPPRITCLILL